MKRLSAQLVERVRLARLASGGLVSEPHSLFDTITDSIVPVHSDGYKFLAIGAVVSLAAVPAVAAAGLAGRRW